MKIQAIKSGQQSKHEEIIEYLKQDDGYWLENDIWNINDEVFENPKYKVFIKNIELDYVKNEILKNEVKYYLVYSLKNEYVSLSALFNAYLPAIKYLFKYIDTNLKDKRSFNNIDIEPMKWKIFILQSGFKITSKGNLSCNGIYWRIHYLISDFIKNFYDDREETEKDIWHAKNIRGAKVSATLTRKTNGLNFIEIPVYYRETVKRYFKSIITKKSWSHCYNILVNLKYFFRYFYSDGCNDGFVENLCRIDIENFLYYLGNERKNKNITETSKYVSYIRTFLEYIQMAQYDKAPKKEVSFLIFQDDIPKRELRKDVIKRAKFIPEPILKQLDNNIMCLDRPQYIPVYILLRETGWRGADIMNLRYYNCLEQIWNGKEKIYNYYLCGEITKTGIAQLKIPIRDKVAEMIQKSIDKAKELSTENNNPKKYLFNTYEGKFKGNPLSKQALMLTIKRLIKQKDIRDANGKLYHFKLHSLRHTRAKEYVEQGMGISIIQQILGHQSLQMTVHYANVTENVLYEKWKNTEDLDLFKLDSKTNKLERVDLNSDTGENLIRYEYVKKNLDAVRVPFGVCFKPSKLPCKQQMNHCLTCASFCTTAENIPEYEEEIESVKKQINISDRYGRELWAEKNKTYLKLLEDTLIRVKDQKILHKNGKSREDA